MSKSLFAQQMEEKRVEKQNTNTSDGNLLQDISNQKYELKSDATTSIDISTYTTQIKYLKDYNQKLNNELWVQKQINLWVIIVITILFLINLFLLFLKKYKQKIRNELIEELKKQNKEG